MLTIEGFPDCLMLTIPRQTTAHFNAVLGVKMYAFTLKKR